MRRTRRFSAMQRPAALPLRTGGHFLRKLSHFCVVFEPGIRYTGILRAHEHWEGDKVMRHNRQSGSAPGRDAGSRLPRPLNRTLSLLCRNPLLRLCLTDPGFRTDIALYCTFFINLAYSAYKAVMAAVFHSAWFAAKSAYYLLIATERFLLLRHLRTRPNDALHAYRRYRFCGALLLTLTAAIAVTGFFTARGENSVRYPGHTVFIVALYFLYNLCMSFINLTRFRRRCDPAHEAAKAISLAATLVSLVSLQSTLLSALGRSPSEQNVLNLITGALALLFIASLSINMIVRGTRSIASLRSASARGAY